MKDKPESNPSNSAAVRIAQLEKELALAREAAQQAAVVKGDFMAKISHEIRTPMNGILGMTELLLETDLNHDQRDFAETIHSSTHVLLGIITDLLDFSRIESGQLVVNHIPFDLKTLVDEAMAPFTSMAREKGVELIIHYAPDLERRLLGDPGWIRQILSRLVHNAVKFTDEGHIFLEIKSSEDRGKQCRIFICVQDTGIGIPEDKLQDIFEGFNQVDNTLTRKYTGTGLGLTLCKKLVDQMGGEIGVKSRPNEGALFWFSLVQPKDPLPPAVQLTDDDLEGLRILVVEPNTLSLRVLTEHFSLRKIRYDTCTLGEEEVLSILDQARKNSDPFQIVLLAYDSMPQKREERLILAIRSGPSTEETDIVILSSTGRRGEADRLAELGAAAYLVKPVSESILFNALQAVSGARKSGGHKELITSHQLVENSLSKPVKHDSTTDSPIILIADNDLHFLQSTYLILRDALPDAEIHTAVSGVEAYVMLGCHKPDCLIFDILMPGINGDELIEFFRSGDRSSEMKIIALTGLSETDIQVKDLQRKGIDRIFFKPFDPEVLIQEITKAPKDKQSVRARP